MSSPRERTVTLREIQHQPDAQPVLCKLTWGGEGQGVSVALKPMGDEEHGTSQLLGLVWSCGEGSGNHLDGQGQLQIDGKNYAYVSRRDATGKLFLWLAGETYIFERIEKSAGGRKGGADSGHTPSDGLIKAPMPGKILQILVASGDTVEAHQPLIVMESMKMEMTLSAPCPAIVEQVLIQTPLTMVDLGQTLVKLTPTPQNA